MSQHFDPVAATREAVADQEGIHSDDLPSLDEWVGSETLQKLQTDWSAQTNPVTFTYVWYSVTVYPVIDLVLARASVAPPHPSEARHPSG